MRARDWLPYLSCLGPWDHDASYLYGRGFPADSKPRPSKAPDRKNRSEHCVVVSSLLATGPALAATSSPTTTIMSFAPSATTSSSQFWGRQVTQFKLPRARSCGLRAHVRSSLSEDVRVSLLQAIASQAASRSQQALVGAASEIVKYVNPRKSDARNLEEALMTVPNLETIPYRVIRRETEYEIREVESYVLAETVMPGTRGFDIFGSSQGFNTLADYIFGKNKRRQKMEMTTPVVVQRGAGQGEKMEMTVPVISQKAGNQWKMSFLMESKYDESSLPLPEDSRVKVRRVPSRTIAAVVFSGFVTDEEVSRREDALRKALVYDPAVRVKEGAVAEVAQRLSPRQE